MPGFLISKARLQKAMGPSQALSLSQHIHPEKMAAMLGGSWDHIDRSHRGVPAYSPANVSPQSASPWPMNEGSADLPS